MNAAPRFDRTDWLLIGGLSLLALTLRLPQLNHGAWFDELLTLYKYLQLPIPDILGSPFGLNNHLFYSLFARASIVAFGESVWAIRLPAVLFGVATVPAAYYLFRQLGRRDVAALASLFLAVSYHHVWFSQNARGYTGLALGTVLASIFILKILVNGATWRIVISYVAAAVFAAGTQLLGVLVIVGHAILCGLSCWPDLRRGSYERMLQLAALFVAAGLLTLAAYGSSLANLFDALNHLYQPEIQPAIAGAPGDGLLAKSLLEHMMTLHNSIPGGVFSLYVALLVLAAGVVNTLRRGWLDAGLVLLPVVVTVTLVTAVSYFFLPRFYFAVAPLLVLLATRGGFALGAWLLPFLNRRQVLLAGCLVALGSALTVPAAWRPKQDFEGLQDWLQPRLEEPVILACFEQMSLVVTRHLGLDCPEFETVEELRALEQPESRVLAIVSLLGDHVNNNHRAIPIYMSRDYRLLERFEATVHWGVIEVYERPAFAAE